MSNMYKFNKILIDLKVNNEHYMITSVSQSCYSYVSVDVSFPLLLDPRIVGNVDLSKNIQIHKARQYHH